MHHTSHRFSWNFAEIRNAQFTFKYSRIPSRSFSITLQIGAATREKQHQTTRAEDMPPRSVCLNVFTSSLSDNGAVGRDDGGMNNRMPGGMERRDSAQSGMSILTFCRLVAVDSTRFRLSTNTSLDNTRRSSAGSIASQPTPSSTSPIPAFNRADFVHSLRPMASTESLNIALTSKRKFCSLPLWLAAGTRFLSFSGISVTWMVHFSALLSPRFCLKIPSDNNKLFICF